MRERLLLAGAALMAFGASLGSGLHFDDYAIFADPALASPAGWLQVWRIEQTRPLTYLTFWLNRQAGGGAATGYHAVNLGLHVAIVLLLHDCLRRLLPARAALLAAAIFAVHPLQTEAVAYVWARSTLLATLLCLLALRSWLQGGTWRSAGWFAAALLAKEECAAFPLVLLALDGKRWKAGVAMLGLSFAAAARVIYAVGVTPGAPVAQQAGIDPARYFLAQGVAVLRYLRLLVWPIGLTVDPEIPVPAPAMGVLAWLLVLALAACALRWRPVEGRWFAAGLILLAPTSSIFPAADLAADRRMYLPMAAFAPALALLLARARFPIPVAACLALAGLSAARTQVWMTEERLWRNAAEAAPGKLRPKLQLARALPPAEALAVLEQARRLAPDDPAVAAQAGAVLLAAGRPGEALAEFGRALALRPRDARNLNNRGAALEALGQREAAAADYRRALEIEPGLGTARENLRRLGAPAP